MKRLIIGVFCLLCAATTLAVPKPGLMQYKLKNISNNFMTPDTWKNFVDGDVESVVTPGALMAKIKNCKGSTVPTSNTWNGVVYTFGNNQGYWYEGFMWLESGKTYSGYSRFDDGGCIYLNGVELYNQGTSSGYNTNTTRTCYTYTPTQSGWYKVQLGIWDWGSNRSCQNGTIAAVQWSTNEPPVATGSGTASLWREFWDADTDDALVGKGELFYSEDPTYVGIDGAPTVALDGDDFVVTAKTGSPLYGGKVYAIFGPSYPFAYTNLLGSVEKGNQTISGTLTNVPKDVVCQFGVYTESDADATKVQESLGASFIDGVVTISANGSSALDAPGYFTVSRPATATSGDLVVSYTVGGTAKPGKHYDALSGTVTIPDGSTSAQIAVVPHSAYYNHTVTVTITPVNYKTESATASATLTLSLLEVKKQIVFTPSGYAGTETLTNFPVLVRLSETAVTGFDYEDVPDASNLRFVTEDKKFLPYEIQKWDTNGTSLVWVRIPEMTASTKFMMYYGGNVEPYGGDSSKTWSESYVGVWHLDTVTLGATPDSSGHGLTATNRVPTADYDAKFAQADGVLGGSIENTAGNDSKLGVKQRGFLSPSYTNYFNGSSYTISGWFNYPNRSLGSQTRHLSTKPSWNSEYGIELDTSGVNESNICVTCKGQQRFKPNVIDRDATGWKKYSIIVDGSYLSFCTNGVLTTIGDGFKDTRVSIALCTPQHAYGLCIGNNATFTETGVVASIDEVRFAMFAESADWAKAEYDTETSETFVTNTGAEDFIIPGFMILVR